MADIATEIQSLSARISTAFDVVAAKGGTVPATKDTYHLSAAIDSIPAGGGGEMPELFGVPLDALTPAVVSESGTTIDYRIANDNYYRMTIPEKHSASAGVRNSFTWLANICQGKSDDSLQSHISAVTIRQSNTYLKQLDNLFANNTNIKELKYELTSTSANQANLYDTMQGIARNCTNLSAIDFNGVSHIGAQLQGAFEGCTSLKHVTFNALTSLDENSFKNTFKNAGLEDISFPGVTVCPSFAGAFIGCKDLTAVNLPHIAPTASLQVRKQYDAFSGCTSLTSNPLADLTGYCFNTACLSATWAGTGIVDFSMDNLSAYGISAYCQSLCCCHNLKTAKLTFGDNAALSVSDYAFVSCFMGCENLTDLSVKTPPNGRNSSTGQTFRAMVPEPTQAVNLHIYGLQNARGAASTALTSGEFCLCKGLKSVYFHDLTSLTNKYLFSTKANHPNMSEIHFKASTQSYWTAHAGYSTAFGLGAGTVDIYFDL